MQHQRATSIRGGSSVSSSRWQRRAAIGLLVCGLVVPALAPCGAQFRAGKVEAGLLLGAGSRTSGSDSAQFLVLRTLGFLVTDALELGVGVGLSGDFATVPSTAIEATASWHFGSAAAVTPYAAINAGFNADVFTASPRIQESLGPGLGIKWNVWENLLVTTEVRYAMQVAEPDHGAVLLLLGFSLLEEPDDGTPAAP